MDGWMNRHWHGQMDGETLYIINLPTKLSLKLTITLIAHLWNEIFSFYGPYLCLTEFGFSKWGDTSHVVPKNACTKLFQTPFDSPLCAPPIFSSWTQSHCSPHLLQRPAQGHPCLVSHPDQSDVRICVQGRKSSCMAVSECVSHLLKVLSNSVVTESDHCLKLSVPHHLCLLLLSEGGKGVWEGGGRKRGRRGRGEGRKGGAHGCVLYHQKIVLNADSVQTLEK